MYGCVMRIFTDIYVAWATSNNVSLLTKTVVAPYYHVTRKLGFLKTLGRVPAAFLDFISALGKSTNFPRSAWGSSRAEETRKVNFVKKTMGAAYCAVFRSLRSRHFARRNY